MIKQNINGWVRVSKRVARKWYNSGQNVCFCCARFEPLNSERIGYIIKNKYDEASNADFEKELDSIDFYFQWLYNVNIIFYYIRENSIYENVSHETFLDKIKSIFKGEKI